MATHTLNKPTQIFPSPYMHIHIYILTYGQLDVFFGQVDHRLVYICVYAYRGLEDIDTRLAKAWTAIDRLLVIWKSDLTDKMKRSFFQAAVMLILLYGCTTWMLTKQMEKKLDSNYTRML